MSYYDHNYDADVGSVSFNLEHRKINQNYIQTQWNRTICPRCKTQWSISGACSCVVHKDINTYKVVLIKKDMSNQDSKNYPHFVDELGDYEEDFFIVNKVKPDEYYLAKKFFEINDIKEFEVIK